MPPRLRGRSLCEDPHDHAAEGGDEQNRGKESHSHKKSLSRVSATQASVRSATLSVYRVLERCLLKRLTSTL